MALLCSLALLQSQHSPSIRAGEEEEWTGTKIQLGATSGRRRRRRLAPRLHPVPGGLWWQLCWPCTPVCIADHIHTRPHRGERIVCPGTVGPAGGLSSLFHVVLCSRAAAAVAAAVAAAAAAATTAAAAEHLREVVHDGGLFRVHEVELPDE